MDDHGSKYYYSRLNDIEKELYQQICDALLQFKHALSVAVGDGAALSLDITKLMTAVLFDNPVFFYVNRERVIIQQTPMYLQLIFQYDYEKPEAEGLWEEVGKRIDKFIKESIKPGMGSLAKQIQVNKYMKCIDDASPPYDSECFTVIGALLRDRCVCEGYAKTYKLICDRLGIASIVVTGEAICPDGHREPHAWNITRIEGVTAHIDTAWNARRGLSGYEYFNLCDADISADHIFDPIRYPKCEPNKINYFYRNNLIAADEEELRKILAKNEDRSNYAVKLLFPISEEQIGKDYGYVGRFCYNKAQNTINFIRM